MTQDEAFEEYFQIWTETYYATKEMMRELHEKCLRSHKEEQEEDKDEVDK